MDNSLSLKIFPYLFLLSSLSLSSAAYTLPQHYFINCGSISDIKVYGLRTFVGDENSGTIAAGKNSPVENSTLSNTDIYRNARIFRSPSVYELDIAQNGTHVVRFHFFPFSALGNLSDARFSVEVSIFRVLSNFSIQNSSGSNFPLIEEFYITIPVGKLRIRFLPDDEKNFFAFVNAMEVFIAPPDLVSNAVFGVSREGRDANDSRLLSSALHVVHRINVGGANITPNSDDLFRNWIPDDNYLLNKEIAKNSGTYGGRINYQQTDQEFIAPSSVYNTAKELSIIGNESQLNFSRIMWQFDVKKGAIHLVRFHFCDIVSTTTNEFLAFNLFINRNFTHEVYPYDYGSRTAAPFYIDFKVDSDDSALLNISVGPKYDSHPPTAFLNGLEIFELVTELGSESGRSNPTQRILLIIIGSCIGGLVLVFVCLTLAYFGLRKKKWKTADQSFNHPVAPLYVGSTHSKSADKTVSGSSHELNLGLKVSFSEIVYATKNFDTKLVIGEGGFGKVYKGMLRNGSKVAVKRSEPGNGQGIHEFHTEIMVLSKIRYQHLVSLIGYCDEGAEMILVYEFMEKGTLREHLYVVEGETGTSKPVSELSWEERLGICIGAAKGIHYLHTGSSGAIIHRDIKSTNILLDSDYVAKVADFGLSRSGPPDDHTHVSTAVKGSFGYLDPDYFRCLQLTQKSDVYSFGVLLLEVVCARPVIDQLQPTDQISLAEWGLSCQRKGELHKIVDTMLVGKINPNSLRKFGQTVDKCLQEYAAERPNMADVLWDLEYCLQLHRTAITRAPYEDSTTDVALGIPINVLQRLPSHTISMENHSCSFSDAG